VVRCWRGYLERDADLHMAQLMCMCCLNERATHTAI